MPLDVHEPKCFHFQVGFASDTWPGTMPSPLMAALQAPIIGLHSAPLCTPRVALFHSTLSIVQHPRANCPRLTHIDVENSSLWCVHYDWNVGVLMCSLTRIEWSWNMTQWQMSLSVSLCRSIVCHWWWSSPRSRRKRSSVATESCICCCSWTRRSQMPSRLSALFSQRPPSTRARSARIVCVIIIIIMRKFLYRHKVITSEAV